MPQPPASRRSQHTESTLSAHRVGGLRTTGEHPGAASPVSDSPPTDEHPPQRPRPPRADRRPVSILPWATADPLAPDASRNDPSGTRPGEDPGGTRPGGDPRDARPGGDPRSARPGDDPGRTRSGHHPGGAPRRRGPARRPVPPSGLVAPPGVGDTLGGPNDPLAALPPWLPPVRRPIPNGPDRSAQWPPPMPRLPNPPPRPRPPLAPPTGQFPAGPPPTSQFPAGPPPTGQFSAGAPPTGQFHATAPATGAFPMHAPPTGAFPAAPPPGGPFPAGAPPAGPFPTQPTPSRPSPAGAPPTETPPESATTSGPPGQQALAETAPAAPQATETDQPAAEPATGSAKTVPTPAAVFGKRPAAKGDSPKPTPYVASTGLPGAVGPAASPDLVPPPKPTERRRPEPEQEREPEPVKPPRLTADAIRHEAVVRGRLEVPRVGWRAALYSMTGGRVNAGLGGAERAAVAMLSRVRRPLAGTRHVAVTSIKGGVGKTTVAACLGLTLADCRGDGVIALDADPDAGTLADRLSGETDVTVREMLENLDSLTSLSEFGKYTSLSGRLRVLAGEQDPAMGEAFAREEYQKVCAALVRFFDVVITDCGTGLVHSAMQGTLALANRLIVVGAPTVDGASRASKTLDWLFAHGHEKLAEEAVLVLCRDRTSNRVDRAQLREHFANRCRHVVDIPADPHLFSGGQILQERLAPATQRAFLELAAIVADGFE